MREKTGRTTPHVPAPRATPGTSRSTHTPTSYTPTQEVWGLNPKAVDNGSDTPTLTRLGVVSVRGHHLTSPSLASPVSPGKLGKGRGAAWPPATQSATSLLAQPPPASTPRRPPPYQRSPRLPAFTNQHLFPVTSRPISCCLGAGVVAMAAIRRERAGRAAGRDWRLVSARCVLSAGGASRAR